MPTRGLSADDLSKSTFWIEGPPFIKEDEGTWPRTPPSKAKQKTIDPERRTTTKAFGTTSHESSFIDLTRFSSLRRLYRITAWVKRFIASCKVHQKTERNHKETLSSAEIAAVERFWIKHIQQKSYPKGVNEQSLIQLNPTKDDQGLLRINGRLRLADNLPYDTKYPVLLPKHDHLTRLIVFDTHETLGHGTGVEHTLTQLRARFWIINGRCVVRSIIKSCPACRRRFSTQTASQMMAPLPKPRLHSLRAFDKIGIDYAGLFKPNKGVARQEPSVTSVCSLA